EAVDRRLAVDDVAFQLVDEGPPCQPVALVAHRPEPASLVDVDELERTRADSVRQYRLGTSTGNDHDSVFGKREGPFGVGRIQREADLMGAERLDVLEPLCNEAAAILSDVRLDRIHDVLG